MVLAKSHQLLEKRYPQTKISWVEFPAGPQMLEALNIGSIDLGSTGDIPPIFAQLTGADLGLRGRRAAQTEAEVILVPKNSPIQSVAQLKGHKVAFQKGSSAHNLLLRALQQAGLCEIYRYSTDVSDSRRCASGLSARKRGCVGYLGSLLFRRVTAR